jgi:drug/metabolite transporter (DMT)-like permease
MNGIAIALLAQILLGLSLVADKIFLGSERDKKRSPLTYTFWLGVLNALGILLVPFGFETTRLTAPIVLLALAGGAIFLFALYFSYRALQIGEASHTLTVMGGFAPSATLIFGMYFLKTPLTIAEQIAFILLTLGGTFMFLSDHPRLRHIALWASVASICFGATNVLQKIVFDHAAFVTGFVILKLGTFLAAVTLLALPRWRNIIRRESREAHPRHKRLYVLNRAIAGGASFLIFYAVSLEHPALIEAVGGFRFVVIFIAALALTRIKPHWLREKFHGWTLAVKIIGTAFIIAGLAGLGLYNYYKHEPRPDPRTVTWGVTFSKLMADYFNLDFREAYRAVLSDLKPKGIRLVAYWPMIEPAQNQWDFRDLDWQMDEAARAGVPVTLAVGEKVPRWPECHIPHWAREEQGGKYQTELLEYLRAVVERYRTHPALQYWQVENEPFLRFGECPSGHEKNLDRKIDLVRSLDSAHPIMLTDGGEFGDWYRAAKRADVFGSTLYRKVHSDRLGSFTYPLAPQFFPLKRDVVQFFTGNPRQKFLIIELGLEPWGKKQIYEIPLAEQFTLLNFDEFREIVSYAREAGFDTYYGWGVEWWYWLKTVHGDDRFWNHMKSTFEGL